VAQLIQSNNLKIFICHASEDANFALNLFNRLKSWGFIPWIDQEDLFTGDQWNSKIKKEINNSDIFIVCLSKIAIRKTGYYHTEITIALERAIQFPDLATHHFERK
jgi:hypothetical protein